MLYRYLLSILLIGCCFLCTITPGTAQKSKYSASAAAIRGAFPNFIGPVNDVYKGAYGAGLEVEYLYFFNPRISFSLPAFMLQSDMFELDQPGSRFEAVHLGAGLRASLWPLGDNRLLSPRLFGGVAVAWEEYTERRTYLPVGVGLNLRVTGSTYLTAEVSYHNSLQNTTVTQDLRDYLQIAAGLYLNLTRINELIEPEIVDTDGDGIADTEDLCPEEAGSLELNGCPDRDGDGIADGNDDCPDIAGESSLRGCPDTDKDGIRDIDDACPTEPGTVAYRGCPVPDRDNDGVLDDVDRCPDESGLARFQGCPDTDNDGTPDPDDDCPEEAGPTANRGCPETAGEVAPEETVEPTVENITFELNSSILSASSNAELNRLVDLLTAFPDYQLRITGYTDNSGTEKYNQWLSERRAKSVSDYLVSRGVAADRLTHVGAGSSNPIGDNATEAGRARNRRVTFELYRE